MSSLQVASYQPTTFPQDYAEKITSHYAPDTIEDIDVIKLLAKTRFPVYLASLTSTKQKVALKLFPYKDGEPCKYYFNESRFEPLSHQNVIQIVCTEDETSISLGKGLKKFSCILMEYAPYGDFFDFMKKHKQNITDKLLRTYFRQLVDGLEYLHKNGVYHLDLKLDNLLMGADFQLKIADFDLSFVAGDTDLLSKGTRFYRAPELKACQCKDFTAADVYSAGVMLFVLKCGGIVPHVENNTCEGINFYELLESNPEEFFQKHIGVQAKDKSFFDSSFKELFIGMTKQNASERMTLQDVKKSRWYQGPVYNKDELKLKMKYLFSK